MHAVSAAVTRALFIHTQNLLLLAFHRCSGIYPAWNFHLVTSLPAMTFGDRFCFSRKGRMGGGGWVHPKAAWPSLGSALEMPWLTLTGPLLSSYAWTGWENNLLALYDTHFQWGSIYPWATLGEHLSAECCDYCQLINGWLWFESRTCKGWL